MITRMPTHCNDATCPSCVIAGDFIFLSHHTGGHGQRDIEHQMRKSFDNLAKTLEAAGASLKDMVQINLYLRTLDDFSRARDIFGEYFGENGGPARMTTTTDFINANCLCMLDGVAYKPAK